MTQTRKSRGHRCESQENHGEAIKIPEKAMGAMDNSPNCVDYMGLENLFWSVTLVNKRQPFL